MSRERNKVETEMTELLPALLRGESASVDRWYRGEHPRVYRLCLGILANVHEAEDVAQDAMVRLLDRLGGWRSERSGYRAWRNTVVTNLCRDRLRRLGVRRRVQEEEEALMAPTPLPDPADDARKGEVRELLVSALARLPEREREVFVIRELEGVTTGECAAILGIGQSTVSSLLSLARGRLRRFLGPRLVGNGGDGDA